MVPAIMDCLRPQIGQFLSAPATFMQEDAGRKFPMDLRLLNRSDFATVMAFKDMAGWNQSLLDWERFLKLNPAGCFACEIGGTVVGIVTTIVYGSGNGCIGALFVAPLHRRRASGEHCSRPRSTI